jgi:hypothetical protein
MTIEDEIVEIILHDSLFDSALASWMEENAVDGAGELYVMLAYDDSTRREIAYEAVDYCACHVGNKRNWKRDIARDSMLGNQLKSMFAGISMLCEVSMDGGALPSAAAAWHQWKLQGTHAGSTASGSTASGSTASGSTASGSTVSGGAPHTGGITFDEAASILRRIVDQNKGKLAKYYGKAYEVLQCVDNVDLLSREVDRGDGDMDKVQKIVSDCRFVVDVIDKGLVIEPLLLQIVVYGRTYLLRGICNVFIRQYEHVNAHAMGRMEPGMEESVQGNEKRRKLGTHAGLIALLGRLRVGAPAVVGAPMKDAIPLLMEHFTREVSE